MPREAEISQNERDFVLRALSEGIRLDNRSFDAFRPLTVSFGEEHGVADIRLGKTRYAIPLPHQAKPPVRTLSNPPSLPPAS